MPGIRTILDIETPGLQRVTVDSIRQSWREFALSPRFPGFAMRDHEREFQMSGLTAEAYVNDSRWVADCPTEGCNGGMMVLPGHPECACFDCGFIHKVNTPKQVEQIEAYLLVRPVHNRNWNPSETVADLRKQNIENEVRLP